MIVLYVAHDLYSENDMCPGSTVCLSIMEKIEENLINVQDCDILKQSKDLPKWLNGTPILVDDEDSIVYRGRDAIKQMHILSRQHPRQHTRQSTYTPQKNESKGTSDSLEDDFHMNVQSVEEQSNTKISEQDLQKFIEARNSSAAGKNAAMSQQQNQAT
jgi:hypothetical protein